MESIFDCLIFKNRAGNDPLFCFLSQANLAAITLGSQAPFFYELNALKELPFGEALPEGFPKWLNIYDLSDVLSYVGEKLFPALVTDKEVGNKKPLLKSHLLYAHIGYWENENTWNAIFETWSTIPELK